MRYTIHGNFISGWAGPAHSTFGLAGWPGILTLSMSLDAFCNCRFTNLISNHKNPTSIVYMCAEAYQHT